MDRYAGSLPGRERVNRFGDAHAPGPGAERGDRLGEQGQTLVEDRGAFALAAVHAIWRRRVLAGERLRHPLTALVRE